MFLVDPNTGAEDLMAHACESMASASVMLSDFAALLDSPYRNTVLGIQQVVMLGELAVNRALIKGFSVVGVRAGEYGRRFPERGREDMAEVMRLAGEGRDVLAIERKGDVMALVADEGLGLFAGRFGTEDRGPAYLAYILILAAAMLGAKAAGVVRTQEFFLRGPMTKGHLTERSFFIFYSNARNRY